MKLLNKLFNQTPKRGSQSISLAESEKCWQVMHDGNMADLERQGIKKRELYGWSR